MQYPKYVLYEPPKENILFKDLTSIPYHCPRCEAEDVFYILEYEDEGVNYVYYTCMMCQDSISILKEGLK